MFLFPFPPSCPFSKSSLGKMARMPVCPLRLHPPPLLQVFVAQLWKARAARELPLPRMANWWAVRRRQAPWRGLQLWAAMPAPPAPPSSPGCSVRAKAAPPSPRALRLRRWKCRQQSRWRTSPRCCVPWPVSPRLWRNSKMWFWKVSPVDILYVNEVGGKTRCGSQISPHQVDQVAFLPACLRRYTTAYHQKT